MKKNTLVALCSTVIAFSCGDTASDPDATPPEIDAPKIDAATDVIDASPADAMPAPDSGPATPTESGQFTLSNLCAVGHDSSTSLLWTHTCMAADLTSHSEAGVAGATVARPGELADDIDITFATAAFTLGTAAVTAGTMLVINGETGAAEIYAVDKAGVAATTTLATTFGNSHVVGGSLHNLRGTIFLVEDKNGGATANTVAEINTVTGAIISSFSVAGEFSVNYGDLGVCQSTGELFIVSDDETTIAEYTPDGVYVTEHPLPVTVAGASGLALGESGVAWVSDRAGNISKLTGMPCP